MPHRVKASSRPQDKIIIALDVPDTDGALRLLDSLGEPPVLCKIGLELFTAQGPSVVKAVQSHGSRVFLDLKFHDIPNTVAHAVKSAAGLGVAMTTASVMLQRPSWRFNPEDSEELGEESDMLL